jgi:hypothetical protein
MNVSTEQILEAVESRADLTAKLIERALHACAKHERPASVTVTFRCKRDKHAPHIVELESTAKIKEPKSATTELSGKTEVVELMRLDCGEDEGQETIDEAG